MKEETSFVSFLFSLEKWVLQPWLGNKCRRRKTESKSVKLCLKIDRVLHPAGAEGLVNKYIHIRYLGSPPHTSINLRMHPHVCTTYPLHLNAYTHIETHALSRICIVTPRYMHPGVEENIMFNEFRGVIY